AGRPAPVLLDRARWRALVPRRAERDRARALRTAGAQPPREAVARRGVVGLRAVRELHRRGAVHPGPLSLPGDAGRARPPRPPAVRESYVGVPCSPEAPSLTGGALPEPARLDLPAGTFKAVRATQTVFFADES